MKGTRKLFCLIVFILFLIHPAWTQEYLSMGPSLGYYRTTDTAAQFNDVVRVRARYRKSAFGVEATIGHKNEIYSNDLVWVKSWPLDLGLLFYPIKWFYVKGGIGYYELYIDYNQKIEGMYEYENESKSNWGYHIAVGLERQVSKSTVLTLVARKEWIDYKFRRLPGNVVLDSNSTSLEASILFILGVD